MSSIGSTAANVANNASNVNNNNANNANNANNVNNPSNNANNLNNSNNANVNMQGQQQVNNQNPSVAMPNQNLNDLIQALLRCGLNLAQRNAILTYTGFNDVNEFHDVTIKDVQHLLK